MVRSKGSCQVQIVPQSVLNLSAWCTKPLSPSPENLRMGLCDPVHSACRFTFPSPWQSSSEQPSCVTFFPLNASHCVCLHQKQLAAQKRRLNRLNVRDKMRAPVSHFTTVAATCHRLRAETYTFSISPPDVPVCIWPWRKKKTIWWPNMSSVAEESMTSCLWGERCSFVSRENRWSSGL